MPQEWRRKGEAARPCASTVHAGEGATPRGRTDTRCLRTCGVPLGVAA